MLDLVRCQKVVERMLGDGRSLTEVEDYIEASALEDMQKAALWMLAWAHQEPAIQLRLAKETLALASGAPHEELSPTRSYLIDESHPARLPSTRSGAARLHAARCTQPPTLRTSTGRARCGGRQTRCRSGGRSLDSRQRRHRKPLPTR